MAKAFSATIDCVAHQAQRYDTVGDWILDDDGHFSIEVSHMGDEKFEALVGVHELIEAILCRHRGIDDRAVTAWDKAFASEGEPGDHRLAPYHREHFFATSIERLLAAELGVDWAEYEAAIAALSQE